MTNAWNYARDWGITTDADYPYTSSYGACKRDDTKIAARAGDMGVITPT